MSREWRPNGITKWKAFELRDSSKEQVATILKTKVSGVSPERVEQFIQQLEKAVSIYHLMRKVATNSKPSSVRKNLKNAQKKALEFNRKLNELDSNSHLLITEINGEGVDGIRSKLGEIIKTLSGALSLANEYPKAGRLSEFEKRNLGQAIAEAIQTVLDVKPSSTREGLLEQCYSIVYQDITEDKSADGVHTVIERVISELPRNQGK